MNETDSLFFALNNKEGEVPERIQLLPAGPLIKGIDGRSWTLNNPLAVINASNAIMPNHPIDENHSTDLQAPLGGPSPAMGWFNNITMKANGEIWANVEWTEKGQNAISKREYRYLSPAFTFTPDGEVTLIVRAALTNNPNVSLTALNAQHIIPVTKPDKEFYMDEISKALGLPNTASEQDVLSAISKLKMATNAAIPQQVDLAVYAPRADLSAMEARALAAEQQLTAINAAQLKKDAETAVDEALKAGKIAPASKDEYLALCSSQAGLESFRKIMAASPGFVNNNPEIPPGTPPSESTALNAAELEVARASGYTEEEWKKLKEAEKK